VLLGATINMDAPRQPHPASLRERGILDILASKRRYHTVTDPTKPHRGNYGKPAEIGGRRPGDACARALLSLEAW